MTREPTKVETLARTAMASLDNGGHVASADVRELAESVLWLGDQWADACAEERRLSVADQLLRECVLYRAGEADGLVPDWTAWAQRYTDYRASGPPGIPDDLDALRARIAADVATDSRPVLEDWETCPNCCTPWKCNGPHAPTTQEKP